MWEKRYNLIEPHRTNTNIRYYTDFDLKKILNVAVLNRNGIKISSIARLNDLELKEEIIRVSTVNPSQGNIIDSLTLAMIDLDDYKLIHIIDKSISKLGFKATVMDVLFPFLLKVGIFWQAGDINPTQEHLVSYLVRQKIIAATENLSSAFNPEGKKFLLFLPEGEWHEMGLLFTQYLLKEAGHEAVYLGQSVPYSDVLAFGASKEFDQLLVSSTVSQSGFDFFIYLKDLGGAFPDKKILYFTYFNCKRASELTAKHLQIRNLDEFNQYLVDLKT